MNDKAIVSNLLALFKPYIKTIIVMMVCLTASTVANFLMPLASKHIMDDGFLKNDFNTVAVYAMIVFVLEGFDKLLNIFKEKFRADISAKIKYSLYEQAYNHITKLKIQYFNSTNYAQIFNNVNVDVENMSSIADNSLFFAITQVFSMIGGIIGMLLINWKLAIIVLCFIPAKYITVKYFAIKRKRMVAEYIESTSDFAQWFGDTVGGIKEIRIFGILVNKQKEFERKQCRSVNNEKRIAILDALGRATESILLQLLVMLLYIIGANMVFDLKLTIGSIFAFLTYSAYVTTPISAILNIGYMLSGIIPSARRFYEFLNLEVEEQFTLNEKANLSLIPQFETVRGSIQFSEVCFSYITGQPVLHNVSFSIAEGEKVAFIGLNGSGKSTIIELILRFYKPDSGKITLDGIDIEEFDTDEYRKNITVVSQQVYLFNASIHDNIALYSNIDDSVIRQAIEASQLSEFMSISSGNSKVGQNGMMLSGGQRQKIALARALVHGKQIFILDEATSNLDVKSEMNINQLLDTRLKDKTVIIVAHKLEVLKRVDKIILLKNGRVNQIGTHDKLSSDNELYRKMITLFEK